MLKERVEKVLNDQIQKEAYSSNLYLSMAIWAETNGFEGSANWFYAQAAEENMHMLKFVHFINERGGKAIIPQIDAPPTDWKDIFVLFEEALKHEQYISESINELVGVTIDERDFPTNNWLQWFVTEQIEEEASVQNIIDKLNLIKDAKGSLYMFDRDIMQIRGEGEANA
jgi:ferritin